MTSDNTDNPEKLPRRGDRIPAEIIDSALTRRTTIDTNLAKLEGIVGPDEAVQSVEQTAEQLAHLAALERAQAGLASYGVEGTVTDQQTAHPTDDTSALDIEAIRGQIGDAYDQETPQQ